MKPFASLAVLILAAAPLSAGTVYVPLVKHQAGNRTLATKVWVANTGEVTRSLNAVFLPVFTDGTQGRGPADSRSVEAGQTLQLINLSPTGVQGMVEITGAPQLAVTAALEGASPALAKVHVPVISSENRVAGGKTASLLGLDRTANGTVTHLGIVNLAHAAQTCNVRAFVAGGRQIASVDVPLPPLSLNDFSDAIGILGQTTVSGARFAVRCPSDFYAFATVLDANGARASFVTPAQTADSALTAPGNPPAPNPGTVLVERRGNFFTPTRAESYLAIDLPLERGVAYQRVVVEFDLFLRKWQSDFFHGITALRRPARNRADRILYYGLQLRGDNLRTVLDLGVHDQTVKGFGPWKEGGRYHIRLEYNLADRRVSIQVSQNGAVVHALQGPAHHFDLSDNGNPIRIDFGQDGIVPDSYYPPFGWTYSNLRATAERAAS